MLTLFSIAKPFRGHIDLIQRNSILSWLGVFPTSEIFIFGDEYGTSEVCKELGVYHGGPIATSEYGRPLVSEAFRLAHQFAKHDVLAYLNCDIITLDDLGAAINVVMRSDIGDYLLCTRRYHHSVSEHLSLSEESARTRLKREVLAQGTLDRPSAIDLFVFPRSRFFDIPPFSAGEVAWDNWMIQSARDSGIAVIDATPSCVLVHQRHEPLSSGPNSPEGKRNTTLAGGLARLGTLREADWIIQNHRLARPNLGRRLYRTLYDWGPIRNLFRMKRAIHRALSAVYRELAFVVTAESRASDRRR